MANLGTLTITDSTLSGNSATGGAGGIGGGIYNAGPAVIVNSTIVGNVTAGTGGGIVGDTLLLSSSTIANNAALYGGGIASTAILQNSIVANNSGGNCSGPITSNGYNISTDNSCNFSNSGDRNNTDPKLGPLQYNGGPTQTMALPSGSPAIDAGNPSGCTDGEGHLLKTDQRGMPRHDKEDSGGCDMGAFEKQTD